MTRFFAISFSFIILIQSLGINLVDIVKVYEFVEHAQFHNEKYGDDVFEFMSKHYGELKANHEKEHQEEKEDHQQLPFQQPSPISSLTALELNTLSTDFKILEFSIVKSHNFYYQVSLSSLHSKGLFHPPRHS